MSWRQDRVNALTFTLGLLVESEQQARGHELSAIVGAEEVVKSILSDLRRGATL